MSRPSSRTLRRSRGRRQDGFTLIELLVAVGIGMVLTLAITLMLARQESGRRTLTSVNDAYTGGAHVAFILDRMLRSAGSGFVQAWASGFGCELLAARNGDQLLPRADAFPAPFAAVPQQQRLAPVLVHAGAGAGGSDVLAIMTGSSGLGESPLSVLDGSPTGTSLRVSANVGFRERDLVLVAEGGTRCMFQQVAVGFVGGVGQQVDFGGAYAANTIDGNDLSAMDTDEDAFVLHMGNALAAQPSFVLLGVGDNAVLQSLDLLRLNGVDEVTPIADGVADMRVLYGIDADGDQRIDQWVRPTAAPWDAATLLDGSANSQQNMTRILAIRVGLLLRTSTPEREAVAPETLTLFPDLDAALQVARDLSADERRLRWRTLDFTVPLRNVMLAP